MSASPAIRRSIVWAAVAAALLASLAYAFRPQPVAVDLVQVARGPLRVTVDEEGEARVRDVFVLSAPLTGRVLRIEAEAGDAVVAGQTVVAEIEPADPAFLDVRSEARAEATLRAAEAARALAEAELAEAEAELRYAVSELQRARRLTRNETISEREVDDAEREHATRSAAVATARARLGMRSFELERARAELVSPVYTQSLHGRCECVPLLAPVDGRILRVLHESERVVERGQPLVEIGDPTDLEVVVDYLSTDAVRITPGQSVVIERWGGTSALAGQVRVVDPLGFTKVSALGIEEQRVNVRIDLTSASDEWQRLGHGYQVEARVVLWEGEVVKLPVTALFRHGGEWAVLVEDQGRARLRRVEVGWRTGLEAAVTGVTPGEQVVLSPDDRVGDGVRIRSRRDLSAS